MRVRAGVLVVAVVAGVFGVLAPGPARCAPAAVEHVVRPGDNLHLIAGYHYRDPRQWKRIWKANRKLVVHPSSLVPGRVLRFDVAPGAGWDIPYEEFLSRVRGQ